MTDLSGLHTAGGLPPMTIEQAVELVNRVRTIQHGMVDFMRRNASMDSLLDHAAHAYKAAILLFDHATEVEQALMETGEALRLIQRGLTVASEDPDDGPVLMDILGRHLTESGEVVDVSHPDPGAETVQEGLNPPISTDSATFCDISAESGPEAASDDPVRAMTPAELNDAIRVWRKVQACTGTRYVSAFTENGEHSFTDAVLLLAWLKDGEA